MDLKQRLGLTYVFISHDLSVVKHISDEVAVMYLGRVVEQGHAETVLQSPLHPYTQALVSAVPEIAIENRKQRIILSGDPPSPENIPSGCAFHPRCFRSMIECTTKSQELRTLGRQQVACNRVGER
jgi:oligopeptide/dipeptide ABC transporter ATP-binding protein